VNQVRGILFLDYVRMLRRSGSSQLSRYLNPEDLELLTRQVDIAEWYPMATFERFGLAILGEVVGSEVDSIRLWGRSQIPQILSFFPELRAEGDPRDTVIRFGNLLLSLFDYPAVTVETVDDESAVIRIGYGMGPAAEEAASWQTLGFFEALVEGSGGEQARGEFTVASWKTPGKPTSLLLRWKPVVASPPAPIARKPRLLLVDDEHLVREALGRILGGAAEVRFATNAGEALRELENGRFDVVVSDQDLGPGTSGLELLRQVATRWPECGRVLHASPPPDEAQLGLAPGELHAVAEKPVSLAEVQRIVAQMQAKRSAP
jgi:CheY-like chemotaxis protein